MFADWTSRFWNCGITNPASDSGCVKWQREVKFLYIFKDASNVFEGSFWNLLPHKYCKTLNSRKMEGRGGGGCDITNATETD
jgi:hypothetical protein